MNEWLLALLVFSPVIGMLFLLFAPKNNEKMIKLIGIAATLPALFISVLLFIRHRAGFELGSLDIHWDWFSFADFPENPSLYEVPFELGIDGLSLVMLVLTAILSTLSAVASLGIKHGWKGYFLLFLLLQTGIMGVFAAGNLILFFIFFEITLVPMFFLIGKWGYLEKERAAYSFLIYNGLGSAVLLIVIMVLFAKTGTSNIEALEQIITHGGMMLMSNISEELKWGLLIGLIVAFGVKLPIFPLHSWMLKVHVQAPPAIVMLHAGVLLKIGAFGLIRFGLGIFPEQFSDISYFIIVLGLVNLLYGAFLALIQKDFKKVLAYSSISHMGIVLIGIGAMNEAGIQGAIFQVVSHGLIAAMLFFLVGVIYERTGTSIISEMGGLAKLLPAASGFLLVAGLASLGLPGMSSFVGEFMAFLGLFQEEPMLGAIGALGLILTAAYVLRAVLAITYGKGGEAASDWKDIQRAEWLPLCLLTGLIVLIGVYPAILADPLTDTLQNIMIGLGGDGR